MSPRFFRGQPRHGGGASEGDLLAANGRGPKPKPRPVEDQETPVDQEETHPREVHVDPRTKFLRLWRLRGGFRISGDRRATAYPPSIAVQMAYEVRRGNPFTRYEPLDFEVDKPPITVRVRGAKLAICGQNLIQLLLERPDFDLRVTGYDTTATYGLRRRPSGTSHDPASKFHGATTPPTKVRDHSFVAIGRRRSTTLRRGD